MRAWYIREQKHILGTSDYAEVDLFETTDKEHTASTRRKRELATSIAACMTGLVDLHGPEVLKHKVFNKVWTPEEKLELVLMVIAGIPRRKVAIEAGISAGMLYQWVYKYKSQGYNGLVESKKGRPTKESRMKKSTNPLPLTESEREELIRLRAENEYIKAENEVIKKRIALRQEKWAAQLKAKKQQSSKT